MNKLLLWIAQGVKGLDSQSRFFRPSAHRTDGTSSLERIDAKRLGDREFRLTASMLFNDAPVHDFAETLPACTYGAELASTTVPHGLTRCR